MVGEDSETLWHYTTISSLNLILENATLLATDYRYLNDSSELSLGRSLVEDWMSRQDSHYFSGEGRETFVKALLAGSYPYVISFSGADDRLSMWRGYSGIIDKDQGVAIGFDKSLLGLIASGQPFSEPRKVTYDRDEIFSELDRLNGKLRENQPDWTLFHHLKQAAPHFKHPGFREEDEYRIIANPLLPIDSEKLLTIGGLPRFKFDLTVNIDPNELPMGISKVRAAPKTDLDLLKNIFSDQYAKKGMEMNVAFLSSDIPFV